jgi:phosphatidylglycerol:prolipoprotein diacylglycerol transferase
MLLYISWNVNPEIFRMGGFALRYRGHILSIPFILAGIYLIVSKSNRNRIMKEQISSTD